MLSVVDFFCVSTIRVVGFLLNLLPLGLQVRMITPLFHLVFWLFPKYRHIAETNLKLAYPESTPEWRTDILNKMCVNHAHLLVDFFRLPYLSNSWLNEHVTFDGADEIQAARAASPNGVLIATGHLGSFELTYHAFCARIGATDVVVRRFVLPRFNRWWNGIRESRGGKVIDRDGAFQGMVSTLREKRAVAMLFDQNIRSAHAVFVDFFGVPAATTKTLGLACVRTKAPIFVCVALPSGGDLHHFVSMEVPTKDVLENRALSIDEKVREITQRTTATFESVVRRYPDQWFWLHRRWKTQPDGTAGRLYKQGEVAACG